MEGRLTVYFDEPFWVGVFKRMQREVRKEIHEAGVGTKAQQAMTLRTEVNKKERRVKVRAHREEEKHEVYDPTGKEKGKRRGH